MWTEDGQSVVSYALLIAGVAIAVLLAGYVFGHQLEMWLFALADRVTHA